MVIVAASLLLVFHVGPRPWALVLLAGAIVFELAQKGLLVWYTRRIPVAAGLGGGSSDAAAALRLANKLLPEPCPQEELHRIAAEVGSDVPFFLSPGPKLARGRGTELAPLDLPQDYAIVIVLPEGAVKESTAAVYAAFDDRGGEAGFESRLVALENALEGGDLEALPANDLASSRVAGDLRELGAFRADVSGAGPVVYGLFQEADSAAIAASRLENGAGVWVTKPAW